MTENEGILTVLEQYQLVLGVLLVALIFYISVKKGNQLMILSLFIVPGLFWIYFVAYQDLGLYDAINKDPFSLVSMLLLAGPAILAFVAWRTAGSPIKRRTETQIGGSG